jgi:hypothetical protein
MTPGRVTPLLVIALGFTFILAAGAADLELTVGGFTGGGGSSSDGDLEHIGSLGDASAGTVRGGTLVLSGGVVAGGGDPSFIFSDGFESGFTAAWSLAQGGDSP